MVFGILLTVTGTLHYPTRFDISTYASCEMRWTAWQRSSMLPLQCSPSISITSMKWSKTVSTSSWSNVASDAMQSLDTERPKTTPIRDLWFNYKLEGIEVFFKRAFNVDDGYVKAVDHAETEEEHDHAVDVLLAYQDIVFRAVYLELNALVELELTSLAKSILQKRGEKPRRLNRGEARPIIEAEYKISLQELPR